MLKNILSLKNTQLSFNLSIFVYLFVLFVCSFLLCLTTISPCYGQPAETTVSNKQNNRNNSQIIPVKSVNTNKANLDDKGKKEQSSKKRTPAININLVESPLPVRVRPLNVDYNKPLVIDQEKAIFLALKNNPAFKIYLSQRKIALSLYNKARSEGKLKADLTSGYELRQGLSNTKPDNSGNFSIELQQLLWDFSHTRNNIKYYESLDNAAYYKMLSDFSALVRDTRLAYYSLIAKRRLSDVARANLENRRNNLALAKAKWESGVGLPADVVRAETLVAGATLELNAARVNSVTASIQFAKTLGLPVKTPLEPVYPFELPKDESLDLELLTDESLQNNPDVKEAEAKCQGYDYALEAAKTSNSPVLKAVLGLGGTGSWYPPESWSANGGVNLSWPLYDSGKTKALIDEAQAIKDQGTYQLEKIKEDLEGEVVRAAVVLHSALGSLESADVAETNARESVRIAEGRYAAGIGTFLEVIDAQNSLLSSSNQLVNALYLTWNARVELDFILGRISNMIVNDKDLMEDFYLKDIPKENDD